jgi:hypothetical protein
MKYKFMARTKIGKWSFWIAVAGFVFMYLNYWIAMITGGGSAWSGFVTLLFILIGGIGSLFAVIRYKDYAISLFLSSLIGIFGLFLIVGELVFPH